MIRLAILLMFVSSSAFGATYTQMRITPEHVGVFKSNKTQQFKAEGYSTKWVDITNKVDWFVEDNGFEGQLSSSNTVSINSSGKATVKASWGRVNISVCYPRGCHDTTPPEPPTPVGPPANGCLPSIYYLLSGHSNLEDVSSQCSDALFGMQIIIPPASLYISESDADVSTTMTIMDVTNWKVPPYTPTKDKAVVSMPVVTPITFVDIVETRISWRWTNGFDGLLWAYYSDDGNKTYEGWGWDYVTKSHYLKTIKGYPRGMGRY